MPIETEYIEFQILNKSKFLDLKRVYELISKSKNSGRPKEGSYWLKEFPDYSLKEFYFADTDLRPDFETANDEGGVWHFYSLTNLLQTDLDVELKECREIKEDYGVLEFSAYGYPYGGITGLTMFLSSFDCKATIINEGGGIYKVTWVTDTEFELEQINKTPANNASKTMAGPSAQANFKPLNKFWSWLKGR